MPVQKITLQLLGPAVYAGHVPRAADCVPAFLLRAVAVELLRHVPFRAGVEEAEQVSLFEITVVRHADFVYAQLGRDVELERRRAGVVDVQQVAVQVQVRVYSGLHGRVRWLRLCYCVSDVILAGRTALGLLSGMFSLR